MNLEIHNVNRREDDFGYLLPLEYGKNLVVLVGDDGQGNLSSKLFEVERTDKFRAEIASPVFGEFANGRELPVSGTVSAKFAEGSEEELGLAGVQIAGAPLAGLRNQHLKREWEHLSDYERGWGGA